MKIAIHTRDGAVKNVETARARDVGRWQATGLVRAKSDDGKAVEIPFDRVTAMNYLGAPVALFAVQGVK
jgi:hypothetical protein